MKSVVRKIFNQEDIEKIVRDYINSFIPEKAKIYYRHSNKWEEFSTYRKESEDCILVEFSVEDIEKEMQPDTPEQESNERPWDIAESGDEIL